MTVTDETIARQGTEVYRERLSNTFPETPTANGNGTFPPPYSVHRKIDVNAARAPVVHENQISRWAKTILTSCPLGDTIAILIFLLSLPSTMLALTNTLFAILTFVPPPAGSISTLPTTLNNAFQGSGGTPSAFVIILTDAIGMGLWLLFGPLQDLALELAQAVVATTLGGGNSNKNGGADSTLLCMAAVGVSHLARNTKIPARMLSHRLSSRLNSLPFVSSPEPLPLDDEHAQRWFHASFIRALVALHILIQGLVHMTRRWYARREHQASVTSPTKYDPEASAGSRHNGQALNIARASPQGSGASSPELQSGSSHPNGRDLRENVSTSKKRRKQGNHVRSQQPLWAAFAATKVTVLREYEQSHALTEAVGSHATDIRNLGSAPFVLEEGCIWVTKVQQSSFFFDASHFSNQPTEESQKALLDRGDNDVDLSKPIYVRINDTNWASARVDRVINRSDIDQERPQEWTGEVYGLSPATTYNCTFVRAVDNTTIHSACISTLPPILSSNDSSDAMTPPGPSIRPASPASPTTTLKKSISALEKNLIDSQNQRQRGKKENKAFSANIKREVDGLSSKRSIVVASCSGMTASRRPKNRYQQYPMKLIP